MSGTTNSGRVPRLRFPEFREAEGWKQKTLSGIAMVVMGSSPRSEGYNESQNGLPLLQGNADIKNRLSAPRVFTSEITKECQIGDILMSVRAPVGSVAKSVHHACIGRGIAAIHSRRPNSQEFLYQWLLSYESRWVKISQGGTFDAINSDDLRQVRLTTPSPAEQQNIADCLSSVDELLAAQTRKVDALKAHKKGLMQQLFPMEGETQPHLRFPEFQNAGEWEESIVGELIVTITPPKKLQTSDYQPEGEFPIVDQSQDYICGWTNDGEAVIDKGLPVIVFGDHTCALKFIDQPFAQGADGIKILRPKRGIDIRFLFCALEADPVVQESYKRHFSILREKKLFYPDPKSGEQHRIASCLSSLDALITLETQKLEALKTHKKGLMQQLFPSPEEIEA